MGLEDNIGKKIETSRMKTKSTIIIGDSRRMSELKDESVELVATSPPYWQLKDYGSKENKVF